MSHERAYHERGGERVTNITKKFNGDSSAEARHEGRSSIHAVELMNIYGDKRPWRCHRGQMAVLNHWKLGPTITKGWTK